MKKISQSTISTIFASTSFYAGLDVDGADLHRSVPSSGRNVGQRPAITAICGTTWPNGPTCRERSNPRANCHGTRQTCCVVRAGRCVRHLPQLAVKQMSLPGTGLRLAAPNRAPLASRGSQQG